MRTLIHALCITALALPLAAQTADSPLVAAAKLSKKDRKPSKNAIVITNDNLTKTGGKITTTTINNPLPPAPTDPTAAAAQVLQAMAAKDRAEAEAKVKAAAAKAEKTLRNAAADFYGDSIESKNDDPAAQEHVMQQATTKQPQSSKHTSKPPQP